MEILTEFDGLQEALKKVNIDEAVMPYANGRLVDADAFNKTQKILNCPEMISAHKYLYNLDMDQLTEEEMCKIDQLYKLGCDRGFIADDLTDWDSGTDCEQADQPAVEKPLDDGKTPEEKPVCGTLFKAKIPCWTIIYSATSKDGNIKTGEAYSNAISASAAKADVNAKLSRIGYSNISILAIEATDECDYAAACICKEDNVEENDMLNGRPHNNHVAEADEDKEEPKEDEEETSKEDASGDSSKEGEEDSDEDSKDEDGAGEDEDNAEDEEEPSKESSDDEGKKSSDDEGNEEDSSSEEDAEEDSKDNSKSDEDDEESKEDASDDTGSDESNGEDSKDELDANKKAELKDKYRKAFKNVLVKCKFDTSFNDLTLEQKVKFFTELAKAWTKNEPSEFMTDKEVEQLNNVVVKPDSGD